MPQNFYTFLIIPKKKSPVKKFTLSAALLRGLLCCLLLVVLSSMYAYYDYIKIKGERSELEQLRRQGQEQRLAIDGLVEKVNVMAMKMEELNQLDKNIRTMANIEDTRYKGQLLGIGGSASEESGIISGIETDQKTIIAKIHRNVDQLLNDAHEQKNSFHALLKYLSEQKSIIAATPSNWPVQGWVTSEFGYRTSPLSGAREFHKGIDIATRSGVSITAPADGIVTEVFYDREMGHTVKIDHGHGVSTWYGHMSKSVLTQGAIARRGDLIGYVGNTGRSTGSHLHYSVFLNGVPVNPRRYMN